MDCSTTHRFANQSKPHKRVTFKTDQLVIVHPQNEDKSRVSIFELRSSKMASGASDYGVSTKIPHGRKAINRARDGVERPYCPQSIASNSTPLKSILKKKSGISRMESILKMDGSLECNNRSALAFRAGRTRTSTTNKIFDRTAPINSSMQDKGVFSRSHTNLPFTPGQKTEAQEYATFIPLSSRNKRTTQVGCTMTTGRSTTANYGVQSSRNPAAKQGNITIIKPLSGVTYDFTALAGRTHAESNYRSAIKAASVGSDRKLNVVGIPMGISDLYPALQKLQNSVEKMAYRTEKLYKDMLTHSSITTAGAERASKRVAFRENDSRGKADRSFLHRSYSSVNLSPEGSWNTKRMGISNSRIEYSSDGCQSCRAALAWQPATPSSHRFPQQSGIRLSPNAGRISLAGLHKCPGRNF